MNNPLVTVFTPAHDARYLDEAWRSLAGQTFPGWEWVVLLNRGCQWTAPDDPGVRVHVADDDVTGVGALKRAACALAAGTILVELDCDDVLSSRCLSAVVNAFHERPDAALVYSDFAQVTADGERDESRFSGDWSYYEAVVDGRPVLACAGKPPTPHHVSYIWYAPNHVRAFRRSAYEQVGGYDAALDVADDADLMCRLYQAGEFVHLPECLYLQRMHPGNTQREPATNARIQERTVALYDRHIEANALAWAGREGLRAVDLGAAHNERPGYVGVDLRPGPGVHFVADARRLPFADASVGVVRAVDFLEHVADPVAMMNEIHRVLAPGGMLLSMTPSTDGRGAFQDPTHVSFWNSNSFWYYTNPDFMRYVPEFTGRFGISRLVDTHPSQWHHDHEITYVTANLVKA